MEHFKPEVQRNGNVSEIDKLIDTALNVYESIQYKNNSAMWWSISRFNAVLDTFQPNTVLDTFQPNTVLVKNYLNMRISNIEQNIIKDGNLSDIEKFYVLSQCIFSQEEVSKLALQLANLREFENYVDNGEHEKIKGLLQAVQILLKQTPIDVN